MDQNVGVCRSHCKVGAADLNEFPREAWPPSVMDVTKKSTLLHFGNRDSAVSLISLHPSPHQVPQTTAHEQPILAVFEITRVKLLALQKLGAAKSHPLQLVLQLLRIEEKLKRLSVPGHTFRERLESFSLPRIEQRRLNRKIKYHAAARRHCRNQTQSRQASFAREIRGHAQPGKKRRRAQVKSRLSKPIRQCLPLEVDGHEGQSRRDRNARSLQLFALPSLRRRMVDLKHPQPGMRVAISNRVETRAKLDVLPHAH